MWKMMIIDDEYFVRMGIRETIDWAVHGVEIVGEADNGTQGLELACRLKPDIIITDIRMPGMNGLDFMRCCREKGLHSRIIVLSAHEEFNYAKTALQQGASDYLLKPVLNEQLIEAVLKAGRSCPPNRRRPLMWKNSVGGCRPSRSRRLWKSCWTIS